MAQTTLATLADVAKRVANSQATGYTTVLADAGKAVEYDSASAGAVTIPPNASVAYPTGTIIEFVQVGAGALTLTPGSGVTITGDTVTPGQGGSLLLRKTGTNAWWGAIVSVRSGTYPDTAATLLKADNLEGIANAATARTNLSAVSLAKTVGGGEVPAPQRPPALAIEEVFPRREISHNVVWADADTLYAFGSDRACRKSVDGGLNWTFQAISAISLGSDGCFLKTSAGTLLSLEAISPQAIRRSTDDGVTWTSVHTLRADTQSLGPQFWDIDSNGHIYYIEYGTPAGGFAEVRIYRSTDDGATWAVFHTFPGQLTGGAGHIRHGHGVQYDAVSDRIYFSTGDTQDDAGIYRVTSDRTAVEAVVKNSQLVAQGLGADSARCIGMMFFPDSIIWACDTPSNSYLMRLPRSQIGQASPQVTRLYRLNSSGWFTCPANAAKTKWLVSASQEAGGLDTLVHLYAVEDNGDTVWEIGTVPTASATFAALAPVGRPNLHGDVVWLRSYNIQRSDLVAVNFQVKARLGSGAPSLLPALPAPAPLLGLSTVSSGAVDMASGAADIIFGGTRASERNRVLVIFEAGARRTSGDGSYRVEVWNITTNVKLFESTLGSSNSSERMNLRKTSEPYLYKGTQNVFDHIDFRLIRSTGVSTAKVFGYVTFGWL